MPEFVALDVFLRPPANAAPEPQTQPAPQPEPPPEIGVAPDEAVCERAGALAEIRRFRAALADALDAAVEVLLRDVACDVLGRELRLAPVEIAAVVSRARERFAGERPLLVRAHPDEAGALGAAEFDVVADARLRRGDVAFDLRTGTIDASLGARLEAVLAPCTS